MTQVGRKYYLLAAILLSYPFAGWCQLITGNTPVIAMPAGMDSTKLPYTDTSYKRPSFVINEIFITGNRKTKPYIIERELPFKTGDSIYLPDLVAKFQRAKELLINTRLFNDAVVSLKSFHGYSVDIQVDVKERWYIFPIPYFKPVDRNISAWAQKDYSLSRINYGLKFLYENVTGRNDKLKLWLISGYTRQIKLSYEQPYADKTLKHGYSVGFSYGAVKELNIATENNKQKFINADSIHYAGKFLNEQWNLSLGYSYRPAIKTRHSFRLAFFYNKIDSAVTIPNPKYFDNNKRAIFYPELAYTLDYRNVDYIPYVLKGFMGDIALTRKGITPDMNLWELDGKFTKGWSLGWKSYWGLQGMGSLKLPLDQPFFNQTMMGYGEFYLRGLEKYVVDGVAAAIVKNTLRREILNLNIPISRSRALDRIPIRVYVKTYADIGYSYNKNFLQNSLVNKMLYTAGAGVDVVTFYDLVLRFEYSTNQLSGPGFYFHIRNDF